MEPAESKSTLYIEVGQCKTVPASSWSVVFLYQFCACNNYKIVLVDTQKNCSQSHNSKDTDNKWGEFCLPPSMLSNSVMKWSELPEIVKSCDLPAIVDAREIVCYAGLCTVLRRLVMSADAQDPSKNLISLLGFRQTSLKTCSEVSLWTKLCEVQAPTDLTRLLQECRIEKRQRLTSIPESIQVLETSLSEPVTTFNAVYRQQKLKKTNLCTDNTETEHKEGAGKSNGPSLKTAYKSAAIITDKRKYKQSIYGDRTKGDEFKNEETDVKKDVTISMAQLHVQEDSTLNVVTTMDFNRSASNSSRTTCASKEERAQITASISNKSASDTSRTSHVSNDECAQRTEDGTKESNSGQQCDALTPTEHQEGPLQNETTETKSKKKSSAKKSATQRSLPTLEHTFAEGPDLTLVDVALFPYIQCFVAYVNELGCTDVLRTIPFVLRWCANMRDMPGVVDTLVECGSTILEMPSDFCCDELMSLAHAKKRCSSQETEVGKGKSRKAVKAAVKRELPGILEKLQRHHLQVTFDDKLVNTELDWDSFPAEVNPCQDVDEKRAKNKRSQVESLIAGVKMLANKICTIVDFCSGGGHVGIVLAHLLPECHVVMIENNEESLRRAVDRVISIGLKNVTLYQSNIDYYIGKFDIGVSLHACGVATDLVLSKCLHHQAAFVSSPCCYGGLQDTHLITYPRSQRYQTAGVTCDEYFIVGHAAEQTSWNFDTEHSKRGKVCMGIIDQDRASAAQEHGYHVDLCSLQPSTCSPKNNLLIGWHKERDHCVL
ncbi:glutathione S-transferase C-terminal domain-containing protein-like [Amphiura filiformis]|uniref:glutathione S-transferase C-terminal domain-containing protein-like n=1 Tax=Amphiura filiformis TaxID=82378 RepID=UPI003B21BA31